MHRSRGAVKRFLSLISLFQLVILISTCGSTHPHEIKSNITVHYNRYQANEPASSSYDKNPAERSLMLIGGFKGNFDIEVWMDWIIAFKGWSDDQWEEFLAQWEGATDLAGKNQVLESQSIRIFYWGSSNLAEIPEMAKTMPTKDMVEPLANEMDGMENVILIGWSKGGNLVLHYLKQLDAGKLDTTVPPVGVILLAPATHPFLALPIWNANIVPEKVPNIVPKAVNICASGDGVCPSTIRGAINIDPAIDYSNEKIHGPFGLHAQGIIDYIEGDVIVAK
ncbi:MAG: hypothetical protein WAM60_01815 [Candidatus Promineifilaceae bacterium]